MCFRLFLLLAVCLSPPTAACDSTDPRTLIREARAWAQGAGEALWPGFVDTPFGVLLITEQEERLYCHPGPVPGFRDQVTDPVLACPVQTRTLQLAPNLLATFPLPDGIPAIVVGTPVATGKTDRAWQLTLLHEHFHQQQFSQPGYFEGVEQLDLSGGDQTGMWMLNYPFPYERPETTAALDLMAQRLLAALEARAGEDLAKAVDAYWQAREAARQTVSKADWAYLELQLWQEGVARWTELTLARRIPALAAEARELESGIFSVLRDLELAERQRLALYPLGAGEALLLEAASADWQEHYWSEPFALRGALQRLVNRN